MSNTTNRLSCILHHESNIPYCTNCLLACLAKHTGRDTQGVAIKETLVGGRVQEITGNEKAVTKVSYFKGTDKSQWKTNISAYDVVSLGEVYDGIELKLKAYGNNVEKLFCVKPDANPEQIQVKLSGVIDLRVNNEGQLVAETKLGAVKFTKPVAYQEINGRRVDVECKYTIADCGMQNAECKTNLKSETRNLSSTEIGDPQLEYGFTVASYDCTKDLIIDPLLASTYVGGSSSGDFGNSLALDTSGNVYVTGWTYSSDFPTTSGAYDTSFNGYMDVFVSKLNSGLTSLLASTYLGGSGGESGYSLTLDTSGNVYVMGYTGSTDFPTTSGAYDTSYNGGNYYGDVFVSKLDSGLTSLLASTYLGGSNDDIGNSLALDTSGNVYVTGNTSSSDFPTTSGAHDTSLNGGYYDVFVSKLDGGLTRLLASTYLGGSADDYGKSLALDTSGNVYVTGNTPSTDFPTTNGAYDTSFNSGSAVFISKLDGGLTSLLASTFLGGFGDDRGYSLSLDTSGNVYVTGLAGPNFPTTSGAYDTTFNGGYAAFVSKLDGGLTSLLASTFLGGSSEAWGYSLSLDTSGRVYVTGFTTSTDFPTTSGAYDTSFNGGYDVFVSKLNNGLTGLLASTYLGGSDYDFGNSLILDTSGHVYVTGSTGSTGFPTTSSAYDTSHNGGSYNVFVSKLDGNLSASAATTPTPSPTPSPAPTPSPTTSPEEENLLEKYAPILYMHSKERLHPTNVKVMLENSELYEKICKKEKKDGTCKKYKGEQVDTKDKKLTTDLLMNDYNMDDYNDDNYYYLQLKKKAEKKAKKEEWKERQTVYGRKFISEEDKTKTVLQYWFFYVYNDWSGSYEGGNKHEGDWEMIQIILDSNKQPWKITYSFHRGGQTFLWDDKEVSKSDDGNHPLVYMTLGGHGCWNKPGNHKWYQEPATCMDCTDETADNGDVLHPDTMSNAEIDEIKTSTKKYAYVIEDMTDWTEENQDWIYWKGYWGKQTKKKMNNKRDYDIIYGYNSGPSSPPYIDYIDDEIGGRWEKPILWATSPKPSDYEICASSNIKIIAHDIEGNVSNLLDNCSFDTSCGGCATIKILYSEKDQIFEVYSLDGEEVTLKISRYNRNTKEVCEVEFDWLEIPRNGKATLRFSPDENPNLEMEIDHDLNGIFDYRVSPNYVEFR
ncbi:SBBP repeat-containing protein [Candidatus Kuenenia sp.]|uniref:autotransporter outer membrane beta-barrel domain-containing protein n=1 Tax=Candidatus Kuenenia sp. TaxID=2499824 RepID=UPI003AF6CDC4